MLELTREKFNYLALLAEEQTITQKIERGINQPSTIQQIENELAEDGLVINGKISKAGIDALEPYRARKAVIVAAGVGSRLMPITINTPKPLIRVHGKRIIDGLIDACLSAGIGEIYIVRGYLAEQFDQLLYKYPMLKFIENFEYNETNNISSAVCARHPFSNAYIFEADLLLRNQKLIKKYQYYSNFIGCYKEQSNDWCFELEDGYIHTHKIGGTNCYQECGISYWDEKSGQNLALDIMKAYEMPGGKDIFWTQVPLSLFHDHYRVEVRACSADDIVEIDTFQELQEIDHRYNI